MLHKHLPSSCGFGTDAVTRPWRRAALIAVAAVTMVGGRPSLGDEPKNSTPPLQLDPAPRGIVFAATYSGDGRQIALAGEDKSVAIHDAHTGKLIRRLEGHRDRVWIAAFSPDGKSLASCSGEYGTPEEGGAVKLWDLDTGKVRHELEGHRGLVFNVTFAPDGKSLLSAGWDGQVLVWEAATGKKTATLSEHTGPVRTIVFAPDGKSFATAGFDGTVRFWDAARFKNTSTLSAHANGVQCLAFSPNGTYLATTARPTAGTAEEDIVLWNIVTGKEQGRIRGPRGHILCLSFSPDGKMLASCGGYFSQYGDVKLFEVASGRTRATFDEHKEWVECVRFSPDGKTLISAGGFTRGVPGQVIARRLPDLLENKPAGDLTTQQLASFWTALGQPDAADSYQAVLALVAAPRGAAAFLKERVKPTTVRLDDKRVTKLIADLDNEKFSERERATRELNELRDLAGPLLRKVLDTGPTLEVKKRATQLLRQFEVPTIGAELLRALRAIEVLEALGTPEARQVLELLAKGIPEALVTREAQASLGRLGK